MATAKTPNSGIHYVNPGYATESKRRNRSQFHRPFVVGGGIVVGVAMVASSLASGVIIGSKRHEFYTQVQERVNMKAANRAEVVATWVAGLNTLGGHITNANLIRLFATEIKMAGTENGGDPIKKSLLDQLPYMQQVMRDFVKDNNLIAAYMLNDKGDIYLGSQASAPVGSVVRQGVMKAIESRTQVMLPVYQENGTYVADLLKPVFMLDDQQENPPVVGVFWIKMPVAATLAALLAENGMAGAGERAVLLQRVQNNYEWVDLSGNVNIQPLSGVNFASDNTPIETEVASHKVFAQMAPVAGSPFVVMQQYDAKQALQPFREYQSKITTITALVIAFIGASVMAIIWYMMGARNRQRVRIQEQSMSALVKAVELRDSYLFGHHERLSRLALDIATRMGLSVYDRSTLYYSAQLSAIGKIFVPQHILSKPGVLTEQERTQLQNHVSATMEVLNGMEFDYPLKAVIGDMNERMDGSGYPQGKEGDAINMLSRILAVADVYCALTSPRSYREEKTPEEALSILLQEASKYDNTVLQKLQEAIGITAKNAQQQASQPPQTPPKAAQKTTAAKAGKTHTNKALKKEKPSK